VNFFGHATVACWHRTAPRFVLGAMLPDFASMSRARVAEVDDADVADGIALHHYTDAAFHRTEGFRELYRRGVDELRARGLARGPACGAAHVGVELLLDGTLVDDERVAGAYVGAIAAADEVRIRWRDERGAARWRAIHGRLATRGVPLEYRDPDQVSLRVALVLSGRPRLALDDGDLPAVADWLREVAPSIEAGSGALLAELRGGLERARPSLG